MPAKNTPMTVLKDWKTVLGNDAKLGEEYAGRDLWPVTAENGAHYFLKRLGPWRNLPLADEARILKHVANTGVRVAEFLPTERATLYAGEIEESFVLMPQPASDRFDARELVRLEETIGTAMAELHLALASYPWSANSYTENLAGSLRGDLMLPPDIAAGFAPRHEKMAAALGGLPTQLVHGDMTPDNVVLRRPGAVSGFIDFDHLPLAPRIWDIAKYLSRRLRLGWRQGSRGTVSGRLDHIAGFLAGYHRTSALCPAEIEALPSAILAGNVVEVSYAQEISAGTLIRRKLSDHDEVLADAIEATRWHLANDDAVAAAVRSSVG